MKVYNTSSGLNAGFYPEAVGKLTDANKDVNAPDGVSLAVDDLGYIKQGAYVSSGNSVILIEKTITENGTYNASDDSADGYSKVVVNVPSGGETFEVEMVMTGMSEVTITTSKTLSETLSALTSGKNVSLSVDVNSNAYTSVCCGATLVQGVNAIYAVLYPSNETAPMYLLCWAGDSGTVIEVESTKTLLIPPQMQS